MVTQPINPLSAQGDLSKTGLKTTSIYNYRDDQDLCYVNKPTLNRALIQRLHNSATREIRIITQGARRHQTYLGKFRAQEQILWVLWYP